MHEVSHGLMADWLGDPTARVMGRLTLNPIPHIDPFMTVILPALLIFTGSPVVFGAAKPVPFNPHNLRNGQRGVAMVAAAGPATNLLIASVLAVWARLFPAADDTIVTLIVINLGLMVFNLIPFPPLDGSRIVYTFSPHRVREIFDRVERLGLIGIGLLILVAFPLIRPAIVAIVSGIATVLIGHNPGF